MAEGSLLVALDRELRVVEAALEAARVGLEAAEVEGEYADSGLVLAWESHVLARREEERLRALAESLDVSESQLDAVV